MSLLNKYENLKEKYFYLEEQLSNPEISSNLEKFKKVNKEYKDLKTILDVMDEYKMVTDNTEEAKTMLRDEDEEMRVMAKNELEILEKKREELESKIKFMLIPSDPDDDKNVIFEIRSGTGGDEASIFAGDLYRMYSKYFEMQGWAVETIYVNEGSVGGFNKIVLEIDGEDVFSKLKFESGAHRVQRVPKTESQGRVHTSAATVAVIPKYLEEDIKIRKDDLKTDTFRASGAGGQHVNKTESGVRFTHIPTGIVAESTDSRSQLKNRDIALQRLYQKIMDAQREKEAREQSEHRKSLVGTGDRSDKIRTYNYPQNRVTDHRIGLTLYSLNKIVEGDLDEIINSLRMAENLEKLKEIEDIGK
ncbi:MAG: peptide chain release factor 1 [Saprospiraceae bacterium]|nr:peptide chain release factor 1 [Saprospiraceae bacterium]